MTGGLLVNEYQAAKLLSLKVATLRRWRFLRRGPAYIRVGGTTIRYDTTDIATFIAAGRVTPADTPGIPATPGGDSSAQEESA